MQPPMGRVHLSCRYLEAHRCARHNKLRASEKFGGRGYSCATYAEMCRIIAKADPALSMNCAAVNALCVAHFERFANDEQREKYLPGVLSGDIPLA